MKRPAPRPAAQAGFTLLELIVALAVSALVALVGASALSGMLDFQHRSARRSDARADVRAAERIVRHEWASRAGVVRTDGSFLEFDTLYPYGAGPAAPVLARVRLACMPAADDQLQLLHSVSALPEVAAPGASAPAPQWQDGQVLASGLRSCAFSLLAQVRQPDGRTQPRWQAQWEGPDAPQLMRLALSGLRADMPAQVYAARAGAKGGR